MSFNDIIVAVFLSIISVSVFAAGEPPKKITATSWLVTDYYGKKLIGTNEEEVRPIASITKLMTVLVVLDRHLDLENQVPIKRIKGISTHIPRGTEDLSRIELIELALVKSDNLAAYLLCANYDGLGFDSSMPCVDAMNKKAQELKMSNTHYVDPTGLYPGNISSATDLVKLLLEAAKQPIIVRASDKEHVKINIDKSPRLKPKTLTNTNPLVSKYHNFIVSKTGWIKSSGGCLAAIVLTEQGPRVIVLLGSKSTKTRIDEVELIVQQIDREDQDLLYRAFGIEREN